MKLKINPALICRVRNCFLAVLLLCSFSFAVKAEETPKKIMHLSFDDGYYFLMDLKKKTTTYNSIFENPFLNKLQSFHDDYGAVFSIYCYTYSPGSNWNIAPLPTSFAQEFIDNSDWLKLGFHNRNSKYDTIDWQVRYYEDFLSVIPAMEGREKCFDLVPRLHTFGTNTTLAFCDSLRNHADIPLKGFLSTDDARISYYLTSDQAKYINKNDSLYDADNDIYFFSSETRLESVKDSIAFLAQFLTPAYANRANIMPIFTHEHMLCNLKGELRPEKDYLFGRMETCIQWAIANGYVFEYPMNIIPNRTPTGSKPVMKSDIITINGRTIHSEKTGTFHIYNSAGVLVFLKENTSTIQIELLSGIYLLRFEGKDGIKTVKKITVS
jgi:hypothetical protein